MEDVGIKMQNIDFEEKYKKNLAKIGEQVKQANYSGCLQISAELTRASLVVDSRKGVFISEFLEWIFKNLVENTVEGEEDKEKEKINKEITKLLDTLNKLPLFDSGDKDELDLLHAMIASRYEVTQFQRVQWIKPRKRIPPFLEKKV